MQYPLRLLLSAPPSVRLQPETTAYVAAVEAQDGQALESTVVAAIDAFITGCKADGVWNAIKAACILAGARTLNGALVPLVGPAPKGSNFVSGDYNRKTGLKGDGLAKRLDTQYKISGSLTGQDLHLGVVGSEALNTGRPLGVYRTGVYTRHYLPIDGILSAWGSSTSVTTLAAGHYISTRLTAGPPSRYLNGSFNVTLNTDNSQPSDWTVTAFVGHGSTTGVSTEPEQFFGYSSARLQMYHIGDGLTALQVSNFSNRVTTLINAIGAAIP
jgi:hypothetical protein